MHPSSRFLVPTLTILNWSIAAAFGSPRSLAAPMPASVVSYRATELSRRQIHNADFSTSTSGPLVGAKPETLNSTMPADPPAASRPTDAAKANPKAARSIKEDRRQLPKEHGEDPSKLAPFAPEALKVVGRVIEGSRRWYPVKKEMLPVVPAQISTMAKSIPALESIPFLGKREGQSKEDTVSMSPEVTRTPQENHRVRMQRHAGRLGSSTNEHIPRDIFKPDSQRLSRQLVKHELNRMPATGASKVKDEHNELRGHVGRWTLLDKKVLETKNKLRAAT